MSSKNLIEYWSNEKATNVPRRTKIARKSVCSPGSRRQSASTKCLIRVKSFLDFAFSGSLLWGIDPEKIASHHRLSEQEEVFECHNSGIFLIKCAISPVAGSWITPNYRKTFPHPTTVFPPRVTNTTSSPATSPSSIVAICIIFIHFQRTSHSPMPLRVMLSATFN